MLDKDSVAKLHEHVVLLRAEGRSKEEIERAKLVLDDGRTLTLRELLRAVMARTKVDEERFRHLRYSATPADRGIGGVLTVGRVPRKVIPSNPDTYILDDRGDPVRVMKLGFPYFVFEEQGDLLLVGHVQDRESALGWVTTEACYAWPSRRMAFSEDLMERVRKSLGDPRHPTATASPSPPLPWPILAEERSTEEIRLLADLRALGWGVMPIDLQVENSFQVYVLFTEHELHHVLAELTELQGFLESGRLSIGQSVQVIGEFLTQNRVDFLDFDELRHVVDLFPGGTPSFLLRAELHERLKRVIPLLREQIATLATAVDARECYRPELGAYILPLGTLEVRSK
ncbi:MAG: hypothetical protein Q8K78_04830 [Planctomycetaceae bacterium]|nr:hypothetical protein [Planctomycetaceae bacterium]